MGLRPKKSKSCSTAHNIKNLKKGVKSMTEMGFFVLGFTVCLAILMVSDTVSQAIAAEAK